MTFLDSCGVLEGESLVWQSILGTPNLWHHQKFIVIPDSNARACYHKLLELPHATTAFPATEWRYQDLKELIVRAQGSGDFDSDVHIWVGQLPSLWSTGESVGCI